MIAQIHGTVLDKYETFAVLDISGLGYKIFAPQPTLDALTPGEEATLFTHLAVREDALDLYGFSSVPERNFFEKLISISGIGPKGAVGVLNVATLETLERSIVAEDSGYLTKVSGIGKKTANKIILELKDKIEISPKEDESGDAFQGTNARTDVIDALLALGYTAKEARESLDRIPKDLTETNEQIRAVLKIIGKK